MFQFTFFVKSGMCFQSEQLLLHLKIVILYIFRKTSEIHWNTSECPVSDYVSLILHNQAIYSSRCDHLNSTFCNLMMSTCLVIQQNSIAMCQITSVSDILHYSRSNRDCAFRSNNFCCIWKFWILYVFRKTSEIHCNSSEWHEPDYVSLFFRNHDHNVTV